MRFPAMFDRILPAIRLRTLMILVVVLSIGFAAEADRRKRESLRHLALIAAGRKMIVARHELQARSLREQARNLRESIEKLEHQMASPDSALWFTGRQHQYLRNLKEPLPYIEQKAGWEEVMARNAAWAAAHPAEPWPAQPPEPVPPSREALRRIRKYGPLISGTTSEALPTSPARPQVTPAFGRPAVPTIVKKKE